ncbi:MAG TPA: hypothetical protein PKH77_18950 [Anaerolineae bacterium]|nr:hypothetical protein [Anaerolineae bacterium]
MTIETNSRRHPLIIYTLVALIAILCLAAAWFVVALWDEYRFENHCTYEGVCYEPGDERPDGECVCLYGPTKRKWQWNCR